VKTGCSVAEISKEGYDSKRAVFSMMMMMMMMMFIWFYTVFLFNNFRSLPVLLVLTKVQLASFTAMHERTCLHLTVRVLIPLIISSFYFRN
jgi:ABC-type xylose transport system permease subunit